MRAMPRKHSLTDGSIPRALVRVPFAYSMLAPWHARLGLAEVRPMPGATANSAPSL
jgi:hypothetical protein